jgi:hypothetical protein
VGDGVQVSGCDPGGLACPAGADVVAPETDVAAAVGQKDSLLDLGF